MVSTTPAVTEVAAKSPGPKDHYPILAAFAVSAVGDGLRLAALPLLALTFTTDPVAISGLAIASRLPWLLVALFSGVIADRYDRRTLMFIVDLGRALVITGLVAFILLGGNSIVLLYVVALALGTSETIFDTATQGLLPQVVPTDQLAKANGNLYMANLVGTTFVGPAMGSWLFAFNRAIPFVADAITFVVSSVLVAFHRFRYRDLADDGPKQERKGVLAEVGEGLAWIRQHRLIRTFLMVVTVVNFTQSAAQSLLVLLAVDELGMSKSAFGLLLTASGTGAFFGGMLSARVGSKLGVNRVLLPAIALTIPLMLLIAVTANPIVLGVCLAANAFLGVLAAVQMAALRQRIVPNHLLGRVSGVGQFSSFGIAIPLGALTAGIIATWLNVSAVYYFTTAVVALLLLAVGHQLRPSVIKGQLDQLDTPQGNPS